jgi:hypothetical protein
MASLLWGRLSDWDVVRRTRNNGGVREPEMRLYMIIPGTIMAIVGGVIFGYGAQKGWHWAVVLILGAGVNNFGLYAPIICAITYAVDSYKHLAGEIGLLMALGGNFWVFAMGYFVNNMLATRGYGTSFQLLMTPVYGMLVITVVYVSGIA